MNKLLVKFGKIFIGLALMGCTMGASSDKKMDKMEEKLTDANIAAIVVGANQIDISAAKIAIERSSNPEVRKFAEVMIADHTAVLEAATKLVTRLGVTPVNNDLVHTLAKQAAENEAKLKTLSGAAFDKAYIDHEVAYHKAVNDVVANMLIPGATNKELKDTLIAVAPTFIAHQKHCEMIQAKL